MRIVQNYFLSLQKIIDYIFVFIWSFSVWTFVYFYIYIKFIYTYIYICIYIYIYIYKNIHIFKCMPIHRHTLEQTSQEFMQESLNNPLLWMQNGSLRHKMPVYMFRNKARRHKYYSRVFLCLFVSVIFEAFSELEEYHSVMEHQGIHCVHFCNRKQVE